MTKLINLNHEKKTSLTFNKPGEYVVFFHNISGNFIFDIRSSNVKLDIFGLVIGKSKDVFDIKTIQRHVAPNSTSNILIKGIFDGESKLNYQGLIRIEKEGQQSHAYQKNQNLILSPNAYIESKPFLEILANDVFCTHGSTTGQLNQEEIFYLQSRGINTADAEKLLIEGFVLEIFDKIRSKIPDFNYNLV